MLPKHSILSSHTYEAAGSNQATAEPLITDVCVVTGGTGGVRLPLEQNGAKLTVINKTGSNVVVYPGTGGAINALSVNAGYSVPAGKKMSFSSHTATQDKTDWNTEHAASATTATNADNADNLGGVAPSGYVHIAGAETITGAKLFADRTRIGSSTPAGYNTAALFVDRTLAASGSTPGLNIIDTTSGSSYRFFLNATNNTDADLNFYLTEVGAGTKYAAIRPSVNIPLWLGSNSTNVLSITSSALSSTVGLNFGASVAPSTANLSRHLDLYGGTYGLNINSSQLSYHAGSGSHAWYIGGTQYMGVDSTQFVLSSKQAIQHNDSYLRLNQSNHFTSGVYTPYNLRVDGAAQFGGWGGSYTSSAPLRLGHTGGWAYVHAYDGSAYYPLKLIGSTVVIGAASDWVTFTSGDATFNTCQITTAPINSSTSGSNDTSIEVRNSGGTGDGAAAAISFHCQSQYGMHLHLRPDGYFGIGGWSSGSWRWYSGPGGDMVASGNVTAYSDIRLKENVVTFENPLELVSQLRGVQFNWKDIEANDGKRGKKSMGLIAQEIEEVFPELVTLGQDGDTKTVAYAPLVGLLIEAVKAQQEQINLLKAHLGLREL